MSRRHNILTGEDLPPFSENLVFWAPLTQGDLTDHISGTSMVDGGRGTYAWDSEKGMYLFSYTSGSTGTVGFWNATLNIPKSSSSSYTLFCKIICNTVTAGTPYVLGLGNYDTSSSFKPNVCAGAYWGNDSYRSISTLSYIAAVRDASTSTTYFLPSLNSTWTNASSGSHATVPSSWNTSNKCGERVCVDVYRGSGTKGVFWIKDILIYNRALTTAELEQI